MALLRWKGRHPRTLTLERGALMGVLNVTPDSFSDGGSYLEPKIALEHAHSMVQEGAAIIDIGGESTRPGSDSTSPELELERVLPMIRLLKKELAQVLISIDTSKPEVADAALQAGADLINDTFGLRDPAMRAVCAEHSVPAVLMHMRGTPKAMQFSREAAPFADVVQEVRNELASAAEQALADGVPSLVLDPGFGFGKSVSQNLSLVQHLSELKTLGFPVLVGASRKSTLGQVTGIENPSARDPASIAIGLFAIEQGADLLRVHNVGAHSQAIKMWRKLTEA